MTNYDRFKAFYQTPTLWKGTLCGLKSFGLSQFKFDHDLEAQESLELPNIPHGTVLGKRAEYFFKFCVEQSTNYELIAHNLQIFKGNVTLGELDYVICEKNTGKLLHIELVYKFYCYDPNHREQKSSLVEPFHSTFSRYIGPNRRDNFLYKLERLRNHQLPLLHTPQAIETLKSLEINTAHVQQQVCFLAHVFIPQSHWQHAFKFINKKCIAGYYLEYSAFAKAETSHTYYAPEKYAWKMKPHALEQSFTHQEVKVLCAASLSRGFAPMLWLQTINGIYERFFVVKDS